MLIPLRNAVLSGGVFGDFPGSSLLATVETAPRMTPKTDQNPLADGFGGPMPCETAQTRIPSPAHVFTPLRDAVISSGVCHFMFIYLLRVAV